MKISRRRTLLSMAPPTNPQTQPPQPAKNQNSKVQDSIAMAMMRADHGHGHGHDPDPFLASSSSSYQRTSMQNHACASCVSGCISLFCFCPLAAALRLLLLLFVNAPSSLFSKLKSGCSHACRRRRHRRSRLQSAASSFKSSDGDESDFLFFNIDPARGLTVQQQQKRSNEMIHFDSDQLSKHFQLVDSDYLNFHSLQ